MPLVSVEVGCTVKIGDPYGNNYFKTTIGIKELDTDKDLSEQLTAAANVARSTFDYLYKKIDKEVADRLDGKIV